MGEYAVTVEVCEIRGKGICPLGHRVGDRFIFGDPDICVWANHVLLPFATALRFGGEIPWKNVQKDTIDISCPDPDNTVIFRLSRVEK